MLPDVWCSTILKAAVLADFIGWQKHSTTLAPDKGQSRVACLFRCSVDRSAREAPLTWPKLGLERDTLPRVPRSIHTSNLTTDRRASPWWSNSTRYIIIQSKIHNLKSNSSIFFTLAGENRMAPAPRLVRFPLIMLTPAYVTLGTSYAQKHGGAGKDFRSSSLCFLVV